MARPSLFKPKVLTLFQTHHLLSAHEIVKQLQKTNPSLHKTTVYRVLDSLEKQNIVCKFIFSKETFLYELREDHHDHFMCEVCNEIQRTKCVIEVSPHIDGLNINHHHILLFGVCSSCSMKTNA